MFNFSLQTALTVRERKEKIRMKDLAVKLAVEQEIQNKITQLHEKINKISADNERLIEQNILSSSADQEVDVERIAEEAINCS